MIQKPNEVEIIGVVYKIIYEDKPSDVDLYKRASLWGQIDYWTRTIRIYDNGRSLEDIWHCIWHEIIHGIVTRLNMDVLNTSADEDNVDLLALGITDVLFRNEWFVKQSSMIEPDEKLEPETLNLTKFMLCPNCFLSFLISINIKDGKIVCPDCGRVYRG